MSKANIEFSLSLVWIVCQKYIFIDSFQDLKSKSSRKSKILFFWSPRDNFVTAFSGAGATATAVILTVAPFVILSIAGLRPVALVVAVIVAVLVSQVDLPLRSQALFCRVSAFLALCAKRTRGIPSRGIYWPTIVPVAWCPACVIAILPAMPRRALLMETFPVGVATGCAVAIVAFCLLAL